MKIRKFTTKAGEESEEREEYTPEAGDTIIALASSVYKSEPKPVIAYKGTNKEKAVNITKRGIKALWNKKEVFVKLTEGQTKVLDKVEDLTNRKIVFNNYESEKWGTLVGARVLKEATTEKAK